MEISNSRLKTLRSREYEAVCIISQSLDKTYKEYLLTSDRRAWKIIDKLGINSDVLNFMLLCNKKDQILKDDSIFACNRLRTRYYMDGKVIKEFVEHLQNI